MLAPKASTDEIQKGFAPRYDPSALVAFRKDTRCVYNDASLSTSAHRRVVCPVYRIARVRNPPFHPFYPSGGLPLHLPEVLNETDVVPFVLEGDAVAEELADVDGGPPPPPPPPDATTPNPYLAPPAATYPFSPS